MHFSGARVPHDVSGRASLFLLVWGVQALSCAAFSRCRAQMALSPQEAPNRGGALRAHAPAVVANRLQTDLRWGFPLPITSDDNLCASLDSCEFGGFGTKDLVTMDELVAELTQALRYEMPLMRQMEAKRAMMRAQLPTSEYERFALFDKEQAYTRNLVATDNETFVLLLLCWSPGQTSKIHDHPCEGCWMRVMEGRVDEKLYLKKSGKMVQTGFSRYSSGDVAFVDDCVGFHSIGNPSDTAGAMTLHLYSPPFEHCRAWPDKNDARNVCHPAMTFHSAFGKLC
eukprot:scaffold876_cov243-Pinguiococcus_pyrenoidosus.AAC.48